MAASLRSFAAGDRDAVVELSRQALARPTDQVGNPIWVTREDLDRELVEWEPPPEDTLFVAEEEGRVVGFGGVELPREFEHAELFGPIVAPKAQGHRLGTALLETSTERARAAGATSILTAIGTRNAAGRLLLEGHGFRRDEGAQATYRLRPTDHRPLREAPAGVIVRPAGAEDLERAVTLYRECFPEGRWPDAVWKENIGRGTVYAAEAEGEVIGVLNIDPSDSWIYHVGVTEDARNRHVGAYLLSRALEDYWQKHPGEEIGLDVRADNVPAIRLYRRQGFAPWLVLQIFELSL